MRAREGVSQIWGRGSTDWLALAEGLERLDRQRTEQESREERDSE